MKKNAVIHKLNLAVPCTIKYEDVKNKLKIREDGVGILEEGTLLKPKTGDFRKSAKETLVATASDVKGILVSSLEFKYGETQKIGTVMLEGIVYFDKLKKLETSLTEGQLPAGITYIYKTGK